MVAFDYNETDNLKRPRCVYVVGPTATGKTRLGVALAAAFDGEVVSADSRQVYRYLDIGTGKDLQDYVYEGQQIPYHLIDVAEPNEDYNLYRFVEDASAVVRNLVRRKKLPVIVGGTPLYIKALLEQYELPYSPPDTEFRESLRHKSTDALLEHLREKNPDLYEQTDKAQRKRILRALEIACNSSGGAGSVQAPPHIPLLIAPFYRRPEIHERIENRLDKRLQNGMLDEVRRLHEVSGLPWERVERFGLEYKYTALYLQGKLSWEDFFSTLQARIRNFCKSQEIWFRKLERLGWTIHWIPEGELDTCRDRVAAFLQGEQLPEPEIRLDEIRYGPTTNE